MKRVLSLIFLALFALPLVAQGADYQSKKEYDGLFVKNRIYKLNPQAQLWEPDRDFKYASSFGCSLARTALDLDGTWTGVVLGRGRCAANDEAPKRATGNYLNYLQTVNSAKQQAQGDH